MRGGIVAAAAALLTLVAVAPARDVLAQNGDGGQQAAPTRRCKSGPTAFHVDRLLGMSRLAAQGGAITGPRLAHTALPFAAVVQQLRVPQNAMPPYEASVVSDADVANIYAGSNLCRRRRARPISRC